MLSYEDVLAAREHVEQVAVRTPVNYSHSFSELTGAAINLKLENTQRTGAFKIRGAMNRIAALTDEERERGVVTASAGNHAQGVALAATRAGVDSTIVMPKYAPVSKVEATRRYGGEVVLHGIDYDEAQAHAHEIEREQDKVYVHAFEDERVMAGQGTIGLEIAKQCPDVDTVVVPIGGGGLISGVATALKGALDDVRVVGVQAAGADSAARSVREGRRVELSGVDTVADGIAVREVGEHTFPYISERVDEVVTVDDEAIAETLTLLLERSKTVVEGAGAVALAAVLEERFEYEEGEVIVPALCGGNIDMNTLITVILRGLVRMGRYLKVSLELKDRPGELERVAGIIAREDANVYALSHDRTSRDIAVDAADLEIELETHGHEHAAEVVAALEEAGYEVEVEA
jgi:threonine dehydratase